MWWCQQELSPTQRYGDREAKASHTPPPTQSYRGQAKRGKGPLSQHPASLERQRRGGEPPGKLCPRQTRQCPRDPAPAQRGPRWNPPHSPLMATAGLAPSVRRTHTLLPHSLKPGRDNTQTPPRNPAPLPRKVNTSPRRTVESPTAASQPGPHGATSPQERRTQPPPSPSPSPLAVPAAPTRAHAR